MGLSAVEGLEAVMRFLLMIAALAPLLCACSVLDTDVARGYQTNKGWTVGSAFTTADVRILTNRKHPLFNNDVVCAEPSPDVAKALASAASLTAQGGNGAASGSLGASGASAEALSELAGRSTALLGLRDGLYRACEAYANGALGQDAYALMISRYSQLMTTLFLGQDVTGAAGVEGKAAAVSAVLQAMGNQTAPAPQGAATSTTSTTTTTNNPPAAPTAKTPAATGPAAVAPDAHQIRTAAKRRSDAAFIPISATDLVYHRGVDPKPNLQLAADKAPAPAASDPASAGDAGSTGDTAGTGAAATKAASAAGGASTAAALALTRMNEDYINQNVLNVLVVSCINSNDPTRMHQPITPDGSFPPNTWLKTICATLTLDNIEQFASKMALLEASTSLRPVNPEVAAVQPPAQAKADPAPATAPVCPAKPKAVTTVPVIAYQGALKSAGYYSDGLDGKAGPKTKAALVAYQTAQKLCPSGVADQDTLTKLKLLAAAG